MSSPIRIHPTNSKLFEYRGKPLVLLTATEHYGSVINRPFRYPLYLADAADKHMTLTRLFMLFREQQTPINPYSTCKPESPDFIAPFERTGPGRALDQEMKYDLDRFNPEFFERLHGFLALASEYGIIVEVVLLSNTYNNEVWALNPLNAKNNINGLDEIHWPEYMTLRHLALFERQAVMVRKIVQEVNRYDNVIFEICNEPGRFGGELGQDISLDDINAWLSALIKVVRDTEAALPNQHLIVGQEAWSFDPWVQPSDLTFQTMDYDVVNMHPLPNTTYGGKGYELGLFMSKQLKLRELRDYTLATYAERKPLNHDEDNIASEYKDVEGWTIHRKRAWVTLFSGGHYDYIDFSILPWLETGTPDSQRYIRSWFGYLSVFIHSIDLVKARPLADVVKAQPANTLECVFGVADEDICVYLADVRELPSAKELPPLAAEEMGAGELISGTLTLKLPVGTYQVAAYDPKTGQYSPAITVHGNADTQLNVPSFSHDIVLRVRREA
jgi:hypothetical protein